MKSDEANKLIDKIAGCFHSMSESALSAQIKSIIYSFVNDKKDPTRLCAVVTKNNKLAMDIQTQRPLIHGADMVDDLQKLLSMMTIQRPDLYGECKIIILEEIDKDVGLIINV